MILYLLPFDRVGDFELNAPIARYSSKFEFEFSNDEYNTGWVAYQLSSLGITLYVDKLLEIIVSLSCWKECIYKGRNIIGMSVDEFILHTDTDHLEEPDSLDFENDNIPQLVYEFEDLGLQVWTKNGIIVTVIVSNDSEIY